MSRSVTDGERIKKLAESISSVEFPGVSVEIFDSADAPLAAAFIRVRPGSGRTYTVGVESDISAEQIRKFIQFSLSN